MREVLYRGKCIENEDCTDHNKHGQWIYGHYFSYAITGKSYILTHGDVEYTVDPETLSQFTGLKDKNGVKLFDGDIFDIHQTVNGCSKFLVVWHELGWNAKYAVRMVTPRLYEYDLRELFDLDYESKFPYEVEFEVIGNKFDNPELLE